MDKKNQAYGIIEKLWRFNRIFCSSDYDAALEILREYLPFDTHVYNSPLPYKGWVIPPKWDLVQGVIRRNGKTIFEVDHPLKIMGLSRSFKGQVSLEELKNHLHFDRRNPKRIPYHFRQHYRPWERDWGFCVTQDFYDTLEEGFYDIEIVTKESEGYLKVAEYVHAGKSPLGFAFVAHLDHPGMANDDLAGVAVGIELFKRLSQSQYRNKFTYRLVLVQEIIGSVFYLGQTLGNHSGILESCFLEMLGTKTPFALQSSQSAKSCLESILEKKLKERDLDYRLGPFRSIVCNDEAVWESYGIPMCSLSRYPYPEYHSDQDNMSIICPESLETAVSLLYQTLLGLDQMMVMEKRFEGVFSLAHPLYNLYVDAGQPAFDSPAEETALRLRLLMDSVPLYPKFSFVNSIAQELELPLECVLNYLKQWEHKGLICLI